MRAQVVLLVVFLALAVQGWAVCTVDQSNKILQFNSRIALSAGDLFEKNLPSTSAPETVASNFDQTSSSIRIKHDIDQDLTAILQSPAVDKDKVFEVDSLNQDAWKQQLDISFSQIIGLQIGSSELGQIPSEFHFDQGIMEDVNSNIISLTDDGGSWGGSWGVDYTAGGFSTPAADSGTL